MKLLVAFFALLFSSQTFAWSLSWESFGSYDWKKIKPIHYQIEVNGNNLRVYEWITPTIPYEKCVFVASEDNTQLSCNKLSPDDQSKVQEQLQKETQ